MKTAELFRSRTVLSYEVFPPKPTSPVSTIYDTLHALTELEPDFISVTYGAGGGNRGETFRIASAIRECGMESVAHLSCIGLTREEMDRELAELERRGIDNILALRGDMPEGGCPQGDFPHASDLIAYIKAHGHFNVIAACYPEGHPEAANKVEDIRNLKRKVDAGADHLITQLFFDNEYFYAFLERCQLAGISVPIEAGIMPVINKKQIERMTTLCKATIPKKFAAMMARYEHNAIAMRDAGIAYAVDQIVDLVAQGVNGIHLYTMNNPYIARKIREATRSLLA